MHKRYSGKFLSLITAFVLAGGLLFGSSGVNAASVNDLGKSSPYAREAIQWMVGNNVISGDNRGNFNPGKKISRAELVTLIVKALDIDTSDIPGTATFKDVPKSHWAFSYVEAAYRAGIISGTGNGKFGVNSSSTREQVATIIVNYLAIPKEAILAEHGLAELDRYKDAGKMSDWAQPAIQFAVANNLMSGTGTDTFSPSGLSTKEQIAVILYKYLMAEDNIRQSADSLRKPVVSFNGDIQKLQMSPKLVNEEIFVPLELFRLIGADVTVDEQLEKIIVKSNTLNGHNIYLKTGNTSAYVNYQGSSDPFDDPEAQGNVLTLANAPEKLDTEVLVPVKAVSEAIGLNIEISGKLQLVKITDSSAVKNPLLYNALMKQLQYKGEYKASMSMTVEDTWVESETNISYLINGAINGLNSTAKGGMTVKMPDVPDITTEYETINIGNRVYSKDIETGVWSNLSTTQAKNLQILYFDAASQKNEIEKLLEYYNNLNIAPAGKAVIGGEEVTKYQLKIGSNLLDELIPEGMLESGLGIEDIYNNGLTFIMEIYTNKQGEIVRQAAKITGSSDILGYEIVIHGTAIYDFVNIGTDIEIVKPE